MVTATHSKTSVKVADETWIATALLHRENPQRSGFTVQEIVARAEKEQMTGQLRPGVRVHAALHCVANRPPNPGRYRMLFATGKDTRRLYRPGDTYHPNREDSKTVPQRTEIPESYRFLLDWYEKEYASGQLPGKAQDSILSLRGLGKELWKGVDPDEYVRQLREGWE